jgi:hypothetical protein|tara:strand:- start:156 stop:596 length:441 start_codon:yes stop_codon:yes gene_type:complete
MYEIKQIVGEDVLTRYNEIKIGINKAMEHSSGEWTAVEIVEHVIADPNLFQVWDILKDGTSIAISTTRVLHYGKFTALHIITLGGSDLYDEIPNLIVQFENTIKEHESIDALEYTGRRGFVKQLTTVGWVEKYTTMRKSLKENFDV